MEHLGSELAHWKNIGDKEADDIVASFEHRHGPRALFGLTRLVGRWVPGGSIEGLDDELVAYLGTDYALPPWVNGDAVRRAQRRYQRDAQVVQIVLGTHSLPVVYLNPEISITLMGTGQLVQHVLRRLKETHAFVDTVMGEGALLQRGASWQWLRKVRLNHAIVRRIDAVASPFRPGAAGNAPGTFRQLDPLAMRHHPRNKDLASGVPLDQLELIYVLLSFSWVLIDGLDRLGYRMSASEREDHIRLWAVVGHMIGIVDPLLPGGPDLAPASAEKMFERFRADLLARGDPLNRLLPGAMEGRQLVAALLSVLVDVQRQAVPARLRPLLERFQWLDAAVQALPRTLIRMLCGPPTAAMLHVGRAPFLYWVANRLMLKVFDLRHWNDYLSEDVKAQWRDHAIA